MTNPPGLQRGVETGKGKARRRGFEKGGDDRRAELLIEKTRKPETCHAADQLTLVFPIARVPSRHTSFGMKLFKGLWEALTAWVTP